MWKLKWWHLGRRKIEWCSLVLTKPKLMALALWEWSLADRRAGGQARKPHVMSWAANCTPCRHLKSTYSNIFASWEERIPKRKICAQFSVNLSWVCSTWVELGGSSAPAATLSLFPRYLGCSQIFTQETSLPKGGHQCCRGLWPTSPSSQTMSDHPSEKGICWVLTSCCYLERQNVLAPCQLSESQLEQQE